MKPLSKKNKVIGILVTVLILLLAGFFMRPKKTESTPVDTGNPEEQFGDKVTPGGSAGAELMPILNRISDCFHFSTRAENPVPFTIESVFENFQSELGPITHQSERSQRWDLKESDGKLRRLQLVTTESDEGQVGRELHAFSLDAQGNATPQETEASLALNPPDDRIDQMLKEGQVVDKERSAVAFFPTGGRIEYLEKNGSLSEIQFFQSEKSLKCPDLKHPEACVCH